MVLVSMRLTSIDLTKVSMISMISMSITSMIAEDLRDASPARLLIKTNNVVYRNIPGFKDPVLDLPR